MFRFDMSETPHCERCDLIETIKHQLYECRSAQIGWSIYNDIITEIGLSDCKILSFENVIGKVWRQKKQLFCLVFCFGSNSMPLSI
jgi:hypothetical protein